eukprot:gene14763-10559_t
MPIRGKKKREIPENEERDQPTHPREEWEDERQGALGKSEGEKDLPEETFSALVVKPNDLQPVEETERQESRTRGLNDEGVINCERDDMPNEIDQKRKDQGESQNNRVDKQLEGQPSEQQTASEPKHIQEDLGSAKQEQQISIRQDQTERGFDQKKDVTGQSPAPTVPETESKGKMSHEMPPNIEGISKDAQDKECDKGWTRVEHEVESAPSNTDRNEEKPTMSLAEQIYHSELPPESSPTKGGNTPTQTSTTDKTDETATGSSPFPDLKEEPFRSNLVPEKSAEATRQSHRNLVPTDESFYAPLRTEEKPKHKEDHHHTFLAQAHNDYGKKAYHHDALNQPNPRAEHPPMQAYAAPTSVDMGIRRQEGGGEMDVFQTEDRGRVHHRGEVLHPNDIQRAHWDINQHQAHQLHQHGLQQKQEQLAHVSLVGMAAVTIETRNNAGTEENIDFDLERERLARLQSETARLHGGVVPKDSDVSFAQSEIEKKQRRHQEDFHRAIEVEQVIVPVVYEGTYAVPIDTPASDGNEEESKRLHEIHDHVVQEIKMGAHVDAFDKK